MLGKTKPSISILSPLISILFLLPLLGLSGGISSAQQPDEAFQCKPESKGAFSESFWVEYRGGKILRFQYSKELPKPDDRYSCAIGGSRDSRELEWTDQGNITTVIHFVGYKGKAGEAILETTPKEIKVRFYNVNQGYYCGPGIHIAQELVLDKTSQRCAFKSRENGKKN